jgi:transcription elongation factor GreA
MVADSSSRPSLTDAGRRLIEDRIAVLDAELEGLRTSLGDAETRMYANVQACVRTAHERDRLRTILAEATFVEAGNPGDPTLVEIGDVVMLRLADGSEERYVVAHPIEAAMDDERISIDSPLGQALLFRDVGETIEVAVPSGSYQCTILSAVPA